MNRLNIYSIKYKKSVYHHDVAIDIEIANFPVTQIVVTFTAIPEIVLLLRDDPNISVGLVLFCLSARLCNHYSL